MIPYFKSPQTIESAQALKAELEASGDYSRVVLGPSRFNESDGRAYCRVFVERREVTQ